MELKQIANLFGEFWRSLSQHQIFLIQRVMILLDCMRAQPDLAAEQARAVMYHLEHLWQTFGFAQRELVLELVRLGRGREPEAVNGQVKAAGSAVAAGGAEQPLQVTVLRCRNGNKNKTGRPCPNFVPNRADLLQLGLCNACVHKCRKCYHVTPYWQPLCRTCKDGIAAVR